MKPFVVVLMAFSLASCASSMTNEAEPVASAAGKVHCKREAQTGSHVRVTRCRTEDEMNRDRDEARVMRQVRSEPRSGQSTMH